MSLSVPYLEFSSVSGLRDLYLTEELCDTTVVTESRRFLCHRVVLASVSPYFRAMFSSSMREAERGEVVLPDIPPSIMQTVLNFIYTGEATINMDTVQELFTVSSRLQISPLQHLCSSYLNKELNNDSCFWIYRLAHIHNCRSLLEAAIQYISCHFISLTKEQDFLQLDLEELSPILSSDKLMVSSELDVYHLALRWWQFNCCSYTSIPEKLTKTIRFHLMSPQELEEVEEEFHKELCSSQHQFSLQLRQGMFEDRIICMDVMDREDNLPKEDYLLESYDPVSEVWGKLPFPKYLTDSRFLAEGRYLYISGGRNEDETLTDTLYVFDSVMNEWSQLPSMSIPRVNHGFVAYAQRLYALGGWDGREIIDSAEYYSVPEKCWKGLSNLPLRIQNFGCAQLKGKLYLLGGTTVTSKSTLNHLGFLMYDIASETWSHFPLKMQLSSAGAVTLGDKLLVIGGYVSSYWDYYEPFEPRATDQHCEHKYYVPHISAQFYNYSDPCAKPGFSPTICFCLDSEGRFCGCPVPPLPENLESPGVVRWKDRIYVLGGHCMRGYSYKFIFYWAPGRSTWSQCDTEFPILFDDSFGCATLQVPLERFHSLIPGRKVTKIPPKRQSFDDETDWWHLQPLT
ncbi:actin-binding protein IPP isoform X2 [Xenopus tropicalis]|uniref:Actin-binding protein IPP isoform X2 n=1 Tax=Xenopus tropicalis TaxID=8364 RepID=A0A6I8RY54_XENTR|nr:actin-binding protein IPP isoform X2 [Xenopus tropicalis]|eukprot:XP_004917067.1 PREDICTED: actin-binding protein IPP-like isoform X2 [Xenopus tropicalis]